MSLQIQYPVCLTIAGSDSGGGAGIQADLKTFAALGCYGLSVLTALTSQNTVRVKSILEVPPSFIEDQLDALFEDFAIHSIKIGMLYTLGSVEVVTNRLKTHQTLPLVLDPVMVSTSGYSLINRKCIEALKVNLFPMASLLTPNLPEASWLLGRSIQTRKEIEEAAEELLSLGPRAVVIKGGHSKGDHCSDFLCSSIAGLELKKEWLESERLVTQNTHGTGCTFSAAIAAFLSRQLPLSEAVKLAKKYTFDSLSRGRDKKLGQGSGLLIHFPP